MRKFECGYLARYASELQFRHLLLQKKRNVCGLHTKSLVTLRLKDTIRGITEVTATPLVPEIRLHLITPKCKLWNSHPEICPVPDPYWAFLWPGGQALCRYMLDNPSICKGKNILDIGSGAGASMIASIMCGASFVVANDIDEVAITAMKMNAEENFNSSQLEEISKRIKCSNDDILPCMSDDSTDHLQPYSEMCSRICSPNFFSAELLSKSLPTFDVVLVGDLFYDEDIASRLLALLQALRKLSPKTAVLIGDPGRPAILEHLLLPSTSVSQYELPVACTEENYGFSTASVYQLND